MPDLHHLTIAEAGRRYRARELSPVELTQAYLDRIDALDGQLRSYLLVTGELALEQAEVAASELAAGIDRGPMHGIPYALKDVYETAGIRTTCNSRILQDHVPVADAEVQRRLRHGGGVLLGKQALWEFTYGGPAYDLPWPPALNPWDAGRALMGSSTGSGAAIAAGLCPGAMGSDTGGSIRSPAALCGIAGFKPTYGRVSRVGVLPNTYSFDTCGPMAFTAEDCALMLQVVAGHDPRDPASIDEPVGDYVRGLGASLEGVRIGLIRHWYEEESRVSDEVIATMDRVVEVFRDLGCEVRDVTLPSMRTFLDCKVPITLAEIYAAYEPDLRTRAADFGRSFRFRVMPGVLIRGADHVQALRWRSALTAQTLASFADVDLLLTVGYIGDPPRVDPSARPEMLNATVPSVTTPFNVVGIPTLTVCAGYAGDGFPIGMQIAGRPFDEAGVLAAGHAFETATADTRRRPTLEPAAAA